MKSGGQAALMVLIFARLLWLPSPAAAQAPSTWAEYIAAHVSSSPFQGYLKELPPYWRVSREDVLEVAKGSRPRLELQSKITFDGVEHEPSRLFGQLVDTSPTSRLFSDRLRNDDLSRAIRYLALNSAHDELTVILTGKLHALDAFCDGPEIPMGFLSQWITKETRTANESFWTLALELGIAQRAGPQVRIGREAVRDFGRDSSWLPVLLPLLRLSYQAHRGVSVNPGSLLDKPVGRPRTLVLGEIHRLSETSALSSIPSAPALKAEGFSRVRIAVEMDHFPMRVGGYRTDTAEAKLGQVTSSRSLFQETARSLLASWETREQKLLAGRVPETDPELVLARRETARLREVLRTIGTNDPIEMPTVATILEKARAWAAAGLPVTYQGIEVQTGDVASRLDQYFQQYERVKAALRRLEPGQSRGDSPTELHRDLRTERRLLAELPPI